MEERRVRNDSFLYTKYRALLSMDFCTIFYFPYGNDAEGK